MILVCLEISFLKHDCHVIWCTIKQIFCSTYLMTIEYCCCNLSKYPPSFELFQTSSLTKIIIELATSCNFHHQHHFFFVLKNWNWFFTLCKSCILNLFSKKIDRIFRISLPLRRYLRGQAPSTNEEKCLGNTFINMDDIWVLHRGHDLDLPPYSYQVSFCLNLTLFDSLNRHLQKHPFNQEI